MFRVLILRRWLKWHVVTSLYRINSTVWCAARLHWSRHPRHHLVHRVRNSLLHQATKAGDRGNQVVRGITSQTVLSWLCRLCGDVRARLCAWWRGDIRCHQSQFARPIGRCGCQWDSDETAFRLVPEDPVDNLLLAQPRRNWWATRIIGPEQQEWLSRRCTGARLRQTVSSHVRQTIIFTTTCSGKFP